MKWTKVINIAQKISKLKYQWAAEQITVKKSLFSAKNYW